MNSLSSTGQSPRSVSEANELSARMLICVVVKAKLLFNGYSRKEFASCEPGVCLRSPESCDPREVYSYLCMARHSSVKGKE
jgi:hypothetical protein